jgi:hypothetical protein
MRSPVSPKRPTATTKKGRSGSRFASQRGVLDDATLLVVAVR